MLQCFLLGAALAGAACGPSAFATAPAPGPPGPGSVARADAAADLVRVRLVADTTAFLPGEDRLIGASFDIADGWHIYAQARNDSGFPVSVALKMPADFGSSAPPGLEQPMPQRHVAPGGLLDHVYEHAVTLPATVKVPADCVPGTSLTITAHVEWFVCKDVCVAGAADVSLTVPIVAEASARQASPDEAALRRAVLRVPRNLPESDARVALALQGDTLDVRAPGAAGLTFVPDAACVVMPQLIEDGERAGDTLALRLDPQRGADAAVTGALEVRHADAPSEFHVIHLAAPPSAVSSSR